jgi:hypothetical protein
MAKFLQLAFWNANDLINHTEELKMFIFHRNIDVMLISMYFTYISYLNLPKYTVYHTYHSADLSLRNLYNNRNYH